jgi:AbrB family looped-hinge helix DNA binding protein
MPTSVRILADGRITVPRAIRAQRGWGPGTELEIEVTKAGVLLRQMKRFFPWAKREDFAGMLRYKGNAKTIREMDEVSR